MLCCCIRIVLKYLVRPYSQRQRQQRPVCMQWRHCREMTTGIPQALTTFRAGGRLAGYHIGKRLARWIRGKKQYTIWRFSILSTPHQNKPNWLYLFWVYIFSARNSFSSQALFTTMLLKFSWCNGGKDKSWNSIAKKAVYNSVCCFYLNMVIRLTAWSDT